MEINTTAPFYHINTTNVSDANGSWYEDDKYAVLYSVRIISFIVLCLALVLGVLGNGVVIWVTGFKMKKTVNTVWFLNLAVADFLVTAFLTLFVTYTALYSHWAFDEFMSKFSIPLIFLNVFASVYILVVISVDRCVSVVWPVWARNHRSVRKASCVSLGVWVLALILSTPYFIISNTEFFDEDFDLSDNDTLSVIQRPSDSVSFIMEVMNITLLLLGFVVPFTVIVSCYAVIIHRIRRNRTLASKSSRPFKIIVAVITTFFLCWAPFHIMNLILMVNFRSNYYSETLFDVYIIGYPIATSLAFLNSGLNPLLYVFMGQDFKDRVHKSILKVLENAFQEEVSHSHTNKTSTVISRNKDKLVGDTVV